MKWFDDLKMAGDLACLVRNPNQTNKVFSMTNTAIKREEAPEVHHFVQKALQIDEFKQLWESRYFLNLPPIKELVLFPKDTLGYEYAAYMLQNSLRADFYPVITPDTPVKYISMLSRQSHDLWHVVTGYDTSVIGEIALQSFYTAQTDSALSAALVATGILHTAHKNPLDMQSLFSALNEGYERGKKAKFLLGVRWDEHLESPLHSIRIELRL